MRAAQAILTARGGMTSHAAIVSRELGIPCVVGTKEATKRLKDDTVVTVDGARGLIYLGGKVKVEIKETSPMPGEIKIIISDKYEPPKIFFAGFLAFLIRFLLFFHQLRLYFECLFYLIRCLKLNKKLLPRS